MADPRIEPSKISKPFQLVAVWAAALVSLVAAFLTAAAKIDKPTWMPAFLGISAVAVIVVFVALMFIVLTRYRDVLLTDREYIEYQKWREKTFKRFSPELTQEKPKGLSEIEPDIKPSHIGIASADGDIERRRIAQYQENRGLFLVHSWRPSKSPNQVADIVISVREHWKGALKQAGVERVEYYLGPKFSEKPFLKADFQDGFRLDVSAWGPMLCLGKVVFKDGNHIILQRYIDFEEKQQSRELLELG